MQKTGLIELIMHEYKWLNFSHEFHGILFHAEPYLCRERKKDGRTSCLNDA